MDKGSLDRTSAKRSYAYLTIRMWVLLLIWFLIAVISSITDERKEKIVMIVAIPHKDTLETISLPYNSVKVTFKGPIDTRLTNIRRKVDKPAIEVYVEWRDSKMNEIYVRSNLWKVYVSQNKSEFNLVSQIFWVSPTDVQYGYPEREPITVEDWALAQAVISLSSKADVPVGLLMHIDTYPMSYTTGMIYTLVLLFTLYAMIITEYVNRYFGSVLICTSALVLLSTLGHKPSFDTVSGWVSFSTLMILLGAMIIVVLLSQTGVFDYITLVAYRLSKGHSWLLIYLMCLVCACMSAFLENATVVLLLAPASIRLCEAAYINTKLVLIFLAIYSNLGGAMTPVGAPTNVIITTDPVVEAMGINFSYFMAHMVPVSALSMATVFGLIFLCVGGRIYQLDENQVDRRRALERPTSEIQDRIKQLRREMLTGGRRSWLKPVPNYFDTLAVLEAHQPKMNHTLLAKIGVAFCFAMTCFIIRSMPAYIPYSSLAWISMLSAFLLLILADKPNITPLLGKIEWGLLLYLTSLFILTEVIVELGFISWVGQLTSRAVMDTDINQQTIAGMLLILWTSALLSAIIDNTVVAAMLLKVCIKVAESKETAVSLMPLVWALLLGTSYGCSGTLLGAMSNEFVAAIAENHGYAMSFMDFAYVGFPLTIVTLVICSLYLLAAESNLGVSLPWN